MASADLPAVTVLDQMLHQRHGIAAEKTIDQILDRLSNHGRGLDLGGIHARMAGRRAANVALGLQATQVRLHCGKIHFPFRRHGRVNFTHACAA